MVTLIDRYAVANADMLNSRLAELEVAHARTRNPFEVVASGTVSTAIETISLPLGETPWDLLRLRASLSVSGVSSAGLRANNDSGPFYKHAYIGVYSAGVLTNTTPGPPYASSVFLGTAAGAALTIDLWIYLDATGFRLLGGITGGNTDIRTHRIGGQWGSTAAATSLQLTFSSLGSGSTYQPGTVYRLEGMRA